MKPLSTEAHACAYSMACSDSPKTWIFLSLLQTTSLTSLISSSQSLTNLPWLAVISKSRRKIRRMMHALVYRTWKNRVKGRDCNIPLYFTHLQERALQFNHEEITKESFLERLNERLATSDINQVKADVLPFVRNPKELNIWSNDYFIELAKLLKFD